MRHRTPVRSYDYVALAVVTTTTSNGWLVLGGRRVGVISPMSSTCTKKTENTPCTSLTTLPVPLTRHTNTPGWQPSSVTPDTPSQTV